ncbi:MAG: tetratricopeptide repeat protein [Candidatus Sericytochromatia bacterium]
MKKNKLLFLTLCFALTLNSNNKAFAEPPATVFAETVEVFATPSTEVENIMPTYTASIFDDDHNNGLSDYLSNLKRYEKEIRKKNDSFKWKKVPENLIKAYFWIKENPSDKNLIELADRWIEASKKVKNKELKDYAQITFILGNIIKNNFDVIKNFSIKNEDDKEIAFLIKTTKALFGETKKVKTFIEGHKYSINYDIKVISESLTNNLIKNYPEKSIPYYMMALVKYQKELEKAGKEEREFNTKDIHPFINKAIELEPNNLLYNEKKIEWSYNYNETESFDKNFEDLLKKSNNDTYLAEQIATFYAKNRLVDKSINYLKIALKSDDSRVGLYKKLNSLYAYSNKLNEAIELYEKEIEKFPYNTDFYGELADMYVKNKESNKKITDLFEKAVKNNPFDTSLRVDLGDSYYYEKKTDLAIEQYKESIRLNKYNSEAYSKLLSTVYEKNDTENLIKYSEQALKDLPDFYMANVWLGVAYGKLKKQEEALKYFEKAVQQAPNNTLVRNSLGSAYKDAKKYGLALEQFSKSLKIAPDNTQTIIYMGDTHAQNGNIKKAEETYELALKKDPYNEYILLAVGNFYSDNKNYTKAQELLQKAILINPNLFDARNNLGNVYLKNNKYDEAIDIFENIIKINPEYGTAYYNLACIYSLKKEVKIALEYLEKAVSLDSKLKEIALNDTDFDFIKDNNKFKELIK